MKRIAFISEHASPLALTGGTDNGGQNVYVAEMGKALVAAGYAIDVYTRRDHPEQPEVVRWWPGIRVIHIKAGPEQGVEKEGLLIYMKEFADNILQFIMREQRVYELIHAHFFMSAWVASIVKKVLGIPYIVTFHSLGMVRKYYQKEMDRFPDERCGIERFIVQDADRIIAECPQDKEDLIHHYQAFPEKITIVPCGFNPEDFYPIDRDRAREQLGLPLEEPILLQLGRMVPRKGMDTVIRALGLLQQKGKKALLMIVGGNTDWPDPFRTPEIGRLQEIARQEQVIDNIYFTGRKGREILRYYYAAADIFVTVPWYETFGITPLEAMACGIPVIGSDTGGIKFSVVPGKTGLLVPPNDVPTLAAGIGNLLDNKKLRRQMGKNGIRRVNSFFTWKKAADQLIGAYEKMGAEKQRERIILQWSREFFHADRPEIRTYTAAS
ncbi:MAG TPA: glycosyltransferase family 1 protein [Puia sp.]|nr:glycosyltransferase family 1 protein [Puia sp.]